MQLSNSKCNFFPHRVDPSRRIGAQYSLFGSIVAIWEEDWLIGVVAFAFSLVLPSVKLLILFLALLIWDGLRVALYRTWAERLGPWSMLEVFLVAFTLLLTKSLPFGTAVQPLSGFYSFLASITLSLVAAFSLPHSDGRGTAPSEGTTNAHAADNNKGTSNT